jgi:hypothetical protein
MSRRTLFTRIQQSSIIWILPLVVIYVGLLFQGFWLGLGVFRLYFKLAFSLPFILIVIGYILVVKSRHHALLKFAVIFLSVPVFCLGSYILISYPMLVDKKQFNDFTYYLNYEPQLFDPPVVNLYRCKSHSFSCQQTSFSSYAYPTGVIKYALGIDAANNEVTVLALYDSGNLFMEYAYGNPPRYYDYPERIGDELYYLAYYRLSEAEIPYQYTWMLYRCNLDNTDCVRLPFQYTGDEDFITALEFNEATQEINLFFHYYPYDENPTLIYTYGEHPRCYVEGCEILEK